MIVVATPVVDDWDLNVNVWSYEEALTFRHLGEVRPSCVDFKVEVTRKLQEEMVRQVQGALRQVNSQYLHGL